MSLQQELQEGWDKFWCKISGNSYQEHIKLKSIKEINNEIQKYEDIIEKSCERLEKSNTRVKNRQLEVKTLGNIYNKTSKKSKNLRKERKEEYEDMKQILISDRNTATQYRKSIISYNKRIASLRKLFTQQEMISMLKETNKSLKYNKFDLDSSSIIENTIEDEREREEIFEENNTLFKELNENKEKLDEDSFDNEDITSLDESYSDSDTKDNNNSIEELPNVPDNEITLNNSDKSENSNNSEEPMTEY